MGHRVAAAASPRPVREKLLRSCDGGRGIPCHCALPNAKEVSTAGGPCVDSCALQRRSGLEEVLDDALEGAALLVDGPLQIGAGTSPQYLRYAFELGLAPQILRHGTQPGDEVAGYLPGPLFLPCVEVVEAGIESTADRTPLVLRDEA